jgi:hypothetical protein
MFAKMSMLTEANSCGVPFEIPSAGVEIGSGIRGLEIVSGARSLSDSVVPDDRRISETFPAASPARTTVNSGPVRTIFVVDR